MGNLLLQSGFEDAGVPQTGLSAVVDVWNADTQVQVVTAAAATEVGGGIYQYDFSTFDNDINYSFRFDGGVALPSGVRYSYGGYSVLDKFTDLEAQNNAIISLVASITGTSSSSGSGSIDTAQILNEIRILQTRLSANPMIQVPPPTGPNSNRQI